MVYRSLTAVADASGVPPWAVLLVAYAVYVVARTGPVICVIAPKLLAVELAISCANCRGSCWAVKLAVGLSLAQKAAAARGAECRDGKAAAVTDANGTATEWTVHVIDRFTLPMPRRQTAPQ